MTKLSEEHKEKIRQSVKKRIEEKKEDNQWQQQLEDELENLKYDVQDDIVDIKEQLELVTQSLMDIKRTLHQHFGIQTPNREVRG